MWRLLGLGRDDLCTALARPLRPRIQGRTLDVGNTLLQNLLQDPGALELLLHLGDDALRELPLLALLDLALVADPRLEDRLCLGGEGGLLLELVGLVLELGGFLHVVSHHFQYTAGGVLPWRPQTGSW